MMRRVLMSVFVMLLLAAVVWAAVPAVSHSNPSPSHYQKGSTTVVNVTFTVSDSDSANEDVVSTTYVVPLCCQNWNLIGLQATSVRSEPSPPTTYPIYTTVTIPATVDGVVRVRVRAMDGSSGPVIDEVPIPPQE